MEFASEPDLLETFKAAALSVTKLYKTSAAAASKSRAEGYQECLDDLVSFLDRRNYSSSDAIAIRQWATDRLPQNDNNDNMPSAESDDDNPPPSSPVHHSEAVEQQAQGHEPRAEPTMSTAAHASSTSFREPIAISVPSRDTFNFQSSVPYPPHSSDLYPNLASLDLSEQSSQSQPQQHQTPSQRKARIRVDRSRVLGRSTGSVRNMAGSKRKLNLDELFDLGSIGKDGFPFGKRTRHT